MLIIKKIRWKNFLSTGNAWTEIDLIKSPNTLIVGENGAGKSTILDVLMLVLYNVAFRDIKKDQLVNSINQRDCVGEVEFSSYNRDYRVVRGIKPTIFEIWQDGNLVNQDAASKDYQKFLESVLRMNSKTFRQIVVLGSASFIPFMQLKSNVRREVIEDLLDIRVFSTMAGILKDKQADLKSQIILNEKDIQASQKLIETQQENLNRAVRDNRKLIREAQAEITAKLAAIDSAETDIEAEQELIREMQAAISNEDDVDAERQSIEAQINQFLKERRASIDEMKFYENNNTCPTCTQEIDAGMKAEKIDHNKHIIEAAAERLAKLEEAAQAVSEKTQYIKKVQKAIIASNNKIMSELQPRIKSAAREAGNARRRISDLQLANATELQTIISDLVKAETILKTRHERALVTRELYDTASVMFRDTGIKARILKKYIPVINTLVNKYLAAMDFFVKFELNENFEERILSRHRDEFTYASFSEGEKMRIDLALLFTWRTIARMKNSASTNLLVLDEVFDASLDTSGCDEFLKLIHSLENANVFVISHKGDLLQDKFRSAIRFTKQHNFSVIA